MKILCDTEGLRKAVQVVRNAVPGKGVNVSLNDIMVRADNDLVELSATDLEVSIQYRITDDTIVIDEPGVMCVPESKLAPILKEWKAETIAINESKMKCSIKSEGAAFIIMCADPKEFPKMPKFDDGGAQNLEPVLEIDRDVLADMLRKVAFIGCDVFLKTEKDQIVMVSNDGRRLAEVRKIVGPSTGSGQGATKASCIIPKKSVAQISNVIKDYEGVVRIKIEKNRIFVRAGNTTLCSQLIEGNYPDYDAVIPKELGKEASAESEVFFSAVRRAAVMTTDDFKVLCFTFAETKLHLVCNSPDVGEAKVEIPVEYTGEKFTIGLNPDYINDLARIVDMEKVTMKIRDARTACVFESGDGYRYVLMPMELGE